MHIVFDRKIIEKMSAHELANDLRPCGTAATNRAVALLVYAEVCDRLQIKKNRADVRKILGASDDEEMHHAIRRAKIRGILPQSFRTPYAQEGSDLDQRQSRALFAFWNYPDGEPWDAAAILVAEAIAREVEAYGVADTYLWRRTAPYNITKAEAARGKRIMCMIWPYIQQSSRHPSVYWMSSLKVTV